MRIPQFFKTAFYYFAVVIGILIIIYSILNVITAKKKQQIIFGATFSNQFATYLGLDWKETYLKSLDELKIKYLRIPTYWEEVEPTRDQYFFSDVEWMVDEAAKRGAKITLVVGGRQPRWPECHFPDWAWEIDDTARDEEVLELVKTTVNYFKDKSNIEIWQVENEPLLSFFGECPKENKKLLREEVELVRSLDSRPVMMTASGELSTWQFEGKNSDIFGSTMYRTTWNEYLGYQTYWMIPPSFYRIKALLAGVNLENYWVAELQAEPWFPGDPLTTTLEEMYESMNPEILNKTIQYSKNANPARVYLWGIEWWYYTKMKFNSEEMLEAGKKVFGE